jgi:hypothetical protein
MNPVPFVPFEPSVPRKGVIRVQLVPRTLEALQFTDNASALEIQKTFGVRDAVRNKKGDVETLIVSAWGGFEEVQFTDWVARDSQSNSLTVITDEAMKNYYREVSE